MPGVRGVLVQKTGLSARGVCLVSELERPVFASLDGFWEREVVAAGEVDVLGGER